MYRIASIDYTMSMIHEADNTLIKLVTLVTQSPPWGYINLRPYVFMYYNGGKYENNETLYQSYGMRYPNPYFY